MMFYCSDYLSAVVGRRISHDNVIDIVLIKFEADDALARGVVDWPFFLSSVS